MKRKALTLLLAMALLPMASEARSYSSGGRSFSSGRSSSSFSRSSGFGSSSRSSGSSKSYTSGSGRSYSSGPSSSRSTSPGTARTYSSSSSGAKSVSSPNALARSSSSPGGNSSQPVSSSSSASSLSFDTAAARAQKEASSKRDFSAWKQSQSSDTSRRFSPETSSSPPVLPRTSDGGRSYSGSARSQPVFTPDPDTYRTRRIRVDHYYAPYYTRPLVMYNDNYNSFFWWWLLDRTLDERALWAYHHHADMDASRYQALLTTDANLEARVRQLESQQTPVNPNYVPSGMDRDLMYTDQSIHRAYVTRPTTTGRVLFWLILVPTAVGMGCFLVWLLFYKRWKVYEHAPA